MAEQQDLPLIDLPAPLTPEDVDLRDFAFMPLDISRLLNSEFHAASSDAEWRAGLTLWLKSWHQVPAASIPDDDVALARLAEFGRDVKGWLKVRAGALHGWVKCGDGRLYHHVVAEKAKDAWDRKCAQRDRTEKARAARMSQRLSQTATTDVTDISTVSVTASKGQGQGQKKEKDADAGAPALPLNEETDLFRRGKTVLGANAGGLITRLLAAKNGIIPLARAAIEQAATKQDPREYIGAVIRGRDPPNAGEPIYDPRL